jgi:hypothetical protein
MAVSKYLQAVKDEAGGRPRSTAWYRDKIKEFGQPGAMDLIRDGKRAATPYFGRMNMFFLPIPLRINLLDRLVDFSNNTKFDESTVLNVDYSKLKNIPIIKPALKRYLAGHTKSMFRRVDADEFTTAILLPVQRFKKASASEVWKDSRSMI